MSTGRSPQNRDLRELSSSERLIVGVAVDDALADLQHALQVIEESEQARAKLLELHGELARRPEDRESLPAATKKDREEGPGLTPTPQGWRVTCEQLALELESVGLSVQAGRIGKLVRLVPNGWMYSGRKEEHGELRVAEEKAVRELRDLVQAMAADWDSPAHSDDFRSVNWYGTEYTFTPTQAACAKVLWENWERGTPEVGEQTVLEDQRVESAQDRLSQVFDKGKHPAWGALIVPGSTKGTFRLAPPER